ncbi:recombinase family protein [Pedobacter insulae]|uniref:recombinase family protein n=1 Tax=Pedobacter insulae TaxID=414048 RepID=UPI00373FC62E
MTEISLFKSFAKGSEIASTKRSTNCVIYTRVSTKEQADNNLSLETQGKACLKYAEKCGYSVLANFGGTYESAQTDERKEFASMLSFVKKSKLKIAYIIVYSLERFSRNDNSIWLSGQLRKLGIEIVSVTQPIDTSNPSGQMQQKMLFLFGEFDNQLRKQKCMAGIKEVLLRGEWPTKPPLGFDSVRVNGKRKIVVNSRGKLLRQAFIWKAEEKLSNEAIRQRLIEKGLKVCHQRVPEIFRNPFYCGLVVHRMLDGTVVEGKHEQLISKEIFLKVNGLLDLNTHGYKIVENNENVPLKRFLHCHTCGKLMRGYIVQRKGIHYYKCSTIGCSNNKNADALNKRFEKILGYFNLGVSEKFIGVIKKQALTTFNQLNDGNEKSKDVYKDLSQQLVELNKKIERLEERFIEEEITRELYLKYLEKYQVDKKEIESGLLKTSKRVSNLSECVDLTIDFALNMQSRWLTADYYTKQRLQFLIFPEGIGYDKKNDECRTPRINSLFAYVANLQQVLTKNKSGIPELGLNYAAFAALVAGTRVELVTSGL